LAPKKRRIEQKLAEENARQQYEAKVTLLSANKDQVETISTTTEKNHLIPRRRDNRPRLAPLPSVGDIKDHVVKVETKEEKHLEPLTVDPNPPPFAPELDPQYEKRQYGLGSLTLLDQAGPFW